MTTGLWRHRWIVGAILVAIVAVVGTVGAALAGPANADGARQDTPRMGTLTVSPAGIINHKCHNFGDTVQGYKAAECAELHTFYNSAGKPATRGGGQTFCQRVSDGKTVRCAGIWQMVSITDRTAQKSEDKVYTCGREGGGQCPAGRFGHFSPGLPCVFGHVYFGTVSSKASLPVSGSNAVSTGFNSDQFIATCS